MPTDLDRLQYLIRPTGFLQTREQLEETRKLVDALIKEVEELRSWKYIEDEWPEELETVLIEYDGKVAWSFWQEEQEGDWEVGYKKFRQWYYLSQEDDHFDTLDYYPINFPWKRLPAVPEKEKSHD